MLESRTITFPEFSVCLTAEFIVSCSVAFLGRKALIAFANSVTFVEKSVGSEASRVLCEWYLFVSYHYWSLTSSN